jgi:formylglycine-generating enzyme required for sulfatase activity
LGAHWEDDRWREVILLAAGQLGVVENKPFDASAFLLDLRQMEPDDPANAGRPAVLAGRALADIGARGVNQATRRDVMRDLCQTMQDLDPDTDRPNAPPRIAPRTRYAAGEAWDELGGLPDDLDAWVYCARVGVPGTSQVPGTWHGLLAAKYPVTNVQFERFVNDDGYINPRWWGSENSPAWRWRMAEHDTEWRGKDAVTQPEYWQHPRFGKDRCGYPVVGVSWYEAGAYAQWLAEWWRTANNKLQVWRNGQLETFKLQPETFAPRLPTEAEWLRWAGGERAGKNDRYPWDVSGSGRVAEYETEDGKPATLARANTSESGIGGTSPVAMYPLGESKPFGLWDVAGNVWEWTDSWDDEEKTGRVVRGGSWYNSQWYARPSVRRWYDPHDALSSVGFRLVSPISSGS